MEKKGIVEREGLEQGDKKPDEKGNRRVRGKRQQGGLCHFIIVFNIKKTDMEEKKQWTEEAWSDKKEIGKWKEQRNKED